ncbi:AAA family ATPase [Deinococcus aquatilis]|uniref:AAA family ATPase n=1 Tax=Deinococcus aquatilis TaxID=519440 RepID=UPI000361409E|nr:AAA family ATPase [Deinococcus aquatilis]
MLDRSPLYYRTDPQRAIRELSGIGSKLGKKIVEELGEGDPHIALGTIERNPYSLIEVDGIGFKKADKIALTDFAISSDDVRRHHAGNRSILETTGVLTERLFAAERVKLNLFDPAHQYASVDVEEGRCWLPEELEAEKGLERWMRLLPTGGVVALAELTPAQRAICERLGLDEVQTNAVRAALANRVLLLTGGAGCGKTHVVAALALCKLTEGHSVRGMAFAGKAADRMREAFDQYNVQAEASTIHKALGFQKKAFTVEFLAEDLIVVDESSMLPGWLLWAIVSRLMQGATLVLVGDDNQLPPIGYGIPFVDLIRYGVARAHLSRNYRQADQQGILHMAEGVLNRSRPAPAGCVEMHLGVDPGNLDALFDQLIRTHGGQDFEAWQTISWRNEDVERYNLRAQAIINPHGRPLFEYACWKLGTDPRTRRPLVQAEIREGDKIIVIKNSSTLDIFNGQTGRVVGMRSKPKLVQRRDSAGNWEVQEGETVPHLTIEITGREIDIPEDDVEKYVQLGYVITVHKAQGSDWSRVLIMQPAKVRDDMARKWYYTAITRAKAHLVIVSALRVVAWWTNAASDAPDEPSTLMLRLARPAPLQIHAAIERLAARVAQAAAQPDPWDAPEGEVFWADNVAQAPQPVAQAPAPVALARLSEIKEAFKRMDLDGVA